MKLYNTLTRQKDEFIPLNPGEVRFYSCGPTVYNYFHIGNARPFITFDALRNYFEYKGLKVTFVQNFTDVDDKMINKARAENITVKELGERYINEYYKDARALGIRDATVAPKATENIDEIIKIIKTLEEKGYAYNVDGDVYYSTKKFADYGKLSHQPIDELESGARIEVNENKQDPLDFALWKKKKEGEPSWDSPWGQGRPGWHIECSAMANRFLGETIDIHSGGQDLIFPHHENEVAQSEAANGCPFARFWIHNGYINVDNQKMSKSLGNFFTIREILEEYQPEVVRFFMLSGHYRSPVNFSKDLMTQAKTGLERLYTCLERINLALPTADPNSPTDNDLLALLSHHKENFLAALEDDFNTALAIASLFEASKDINKVTETASKSTLDAAKSFMKELGGILGLLQNDQKELLDEEIERLISERQSARAMKNFVLADEIRDKLANMGIILQDTPTGIHWKRS